MEIVYGVMGYVGEPVFWSSVGLLVGWNVLPQPAWVKAAWDKVAS